MVQPANHRFVTEASLVDPATPAGAGLQLQIGRPATAAAGSTQRILGKLDRGQQNVNMVAGPADSVTGSSPATPSVRWPWVFWAALAPRYPKLTFQIRHWTPNLLSASLGDADDYEAAPVAGDPRLIQVGTGTDNAGGPFVATMWVAGVGNSSTDYGIGHIDKMITAIQPDYVLISHGHNEQHTMTPFISTPTQWKGQMLALTELVKRVAPRASLGIMLQNPDPNSNDQAVKADEYQMVAELTGCGVWDIHQAFLDYRNPATPSDVNAWKTDLMQSPTDKHPNVTGQALIASEVLKGFTRLRNQPSHDPKPSTYLEPQEVLNYNPYFFDDWPETAGVFAAAPTGYRLINATAAPDNDNYSDPRVGRSLKLSAVSAAPSALEFRVPALSLQRRPVNALVEVLIPAGAPDTAGSVQLGSDIHSSGDPTSILTWRNARSNSIIRSKWVPVVLEHVVNSLGAWVVGRVYADTANNASAVINIQRILLVEGVLPRARTARRDTALPARTYANTAALRSLKFLWDADAEAGAHGSSITQLTDTSGAGNHGIQATGTKQFTVDTGVLMNGHKTAKATAANNQWYKLGLTQPAKTTTFTVFRDYVSGSLLGNWGITTTAQSQEVDLAHLGRNPSDRKLTYPAGVRLDAAGNHLLVQRYNYTDGVYELWLDGRLIGARDPAFTVSLPAAPYIVGAYRDTSSNQPYDGRFGLVAIADVIYSDLERRGAQDMLAARYGVTLLDRV